MVDDLVQWLGAQLDEDERTAKAATPSPWRVQGDGVIGADGHWPVAYTDSYRSDEDCRHVSTHDPARVLREIDAKRQLLAIHPVAEAAVNTNRGATGCNTCVIVYTSGIEVTGGPCTTARLLALPYADRPGYREEWRP